MLGILIQMNYSHFLTYFGVTPNIPCPQECLSQKRKCLKQNKDAILKYISGKQELDFSYFMKVSDYMYSLLKK